MPEKKGYLWDPMYGILPDVDPIYYDDSLTEPAVVSAPLPAKFNGSQEAARRYAEGYRWGRENVRDPREQAAPYVGAGLAATMLAPYAIGAAVDGTLGSAAARGLQWVGEKAMPSSFFKGLSYYFPGTAEFASAVSPWADAGALSYWSARGLQDANRRWNSGEPGGKAAAVAEGALSAIPLAAPMKTAFEQAPETMRNVRNWYDFVVKGNTRPYHDLERGIRTAESEAENIFNTWNAELYDKIGNNSLIEAKLPVHLKAKVLNIPAAEKQPIFQDVTFRIPGDELVGDMRVNDIGISSPGQRIIEYRAPGEHPAILAGHPEAIDPVDVDVIGLASDKRLIGDSSFRFSDRRHDYGIEIPFPWEIDMAPVRDLPIKASTFGESAKLGWSRAREYPNGRSSSLLVQAPGSKGWSKAIKNYYDGLRSRMGQNGVVSGSGTMYERGVLSGVPADTEIITTESRLPQLEKDIQFTRTGSNDFDVRGTSPLAHSGKDVDIQVIEESNLGGAKGSLAWSLFRTMHPEEFQRQAQASIEVGNFGRPGAGRHYTDLEIVNPATGKVYSPEELLDEFNSGDYSLQNTINDALSIMKDIKHRNGGSQDQLLKHNRPMALLTNEDPEIQGMVHRAIDTIGKSQVGSGYVNGSEYFSDIDFSNVVENEKFLDAMGLNKKFAKNSELMRNLFDYWYMQNSVQKRGVRGANGIDEALKFTMTGNNQRGGGDASGAGRNTLASTAPRMPFSYEQVGAMQTHLASDRHRFKSVNEVLERLTKLDYDSLIDSNTANYAEIVWNKGKNNYLNGLSSEEIKKIDTEIGDFFKDIPVTIEDISDKIAILSNDLKRQGVSADTVDKVIDGLADIYDVPFIRTSSYGGDYRGVLRANSDAGGVRYFDFGKVSNPEIRPYEFGRPVEKYAEFTSMGDSRYLDKPEYVNDIAEEMAESKELQRMLMPRLLDEDSTHGVSFGELADKYQATAKDYRPAIRDWAERALANKNQREVLDAKIREIEKMPGAKARLRKEAQEVKDAFFGEFSDNVLREMKVDGLTREKFKHIIQNMKPTSPAATIDNLSADEITHVRRDTKGRIVISVQHVPVYDPVTGNVVPLPDDEYLIYESPQGWFYEFSDANLPFANGGLLNRLRSHYGSDDKVLEAVRKFKKGGDKATLNHPKYNAAKEKPMYDYLRYRGLGAPQASGMLGNLAVESWLNADLQQQGGGPAYGLMQAEASRQAAMKNYDGTVYQFGSNLSPEEQRQLDYIIDKGVGAYTPGEWGRKNFNGARDARAAFINADDVRTASDIVTNNFLRPGKPHIDRRRAMSEYYYDKYNSEAPYGEGFLWGNAPGFDFSAGGKIHIKPENRGKFTALKKRTGHSASWFKVHGTPAQKKMAVFELNARKWKHGDGGIIDRMNQHYNGDTKAMLELIRKVKNG